MRTKLGLILLEIIFKHTQAKEKPRWILLDKTNYINDFYKTNSYHQTKLHAEKLSKWMKND